MANKAARGGASTASTSLLTCSLRWISASLVIALFCQSAHALTVLTPPSEGAVVAAGEDFATQVIANAWDMDSAADVQLPESQNLASEQIGAGLYSSVTTSGDPYFFMLNHGVGSSVPTHNGHRHPINTAKYRYLTAKLRVYRQAGGPIPPPELAFQAYFYRNQTSIPDGTFGCSPFVYYTQDVWQIVTVDMQAQPTCGGFNTAWTTYPLLEGLRIDPVAASGANVEVDWVRLTAAPTSVLQSYTVQWSDTSGGHQYMIHAVDSGGARLLLASSASGTSHVVDMTRLPPGSYRVEVSRGATSALSPGSIRINAPPQVVIERPNIRGDQSRNYALVETGNPWGPMDPADVWQSFNLVNINYSSPPGALAARPISDDPYIFFAATAPIDAQKYRSLCYTMQVHGDRDIGLGSVARVMWGQSSSVMTTTDDIIVNAGLNEVCLPDLATVPDEGAPAGGWEGIQNYIRIDPHEFPVSSVCVSNPSPANCRDIRLDSFVLSPFFETNPGFVFQWHLADLDHTAGQVRIYLDPDRDPDNGNWALIATTSASTGTGQYQWHGQGVAPGIYHVFIEADDGVNAAGNYAGGPLRVVAGADMIFVNGFDLP